MSEEPESIPLSVEDQRAFADAILNPAPPNDALKRAATAYHNLITSFDIELDETLDALADAEIDAGKGAPHEKVREWLSKLAKGERVVPPNADET